MLSPISQVSEGSLSMLGQVRVVTAAWSVAERNVSIGAAVAKITAVESLVVVAIGIGSEEERHVLY